MSILVPIRKEIADRFKILSLYYTYQTDDRISFLRIHQFRKLNYFLPIILSCFSTGLLFIAFAIHFTPTQFGVSYFWFEQLSILLEILASRTFPPDRMLRVP